GYELVGEIRGAEMVGWTYDAPFDDLPAAADPGGYPADVARAAMKQRWASPLSAAESHRVVPWEAVSERDGTGIVHVAPGCGNEDLLLGKRHGLAPVAPLDEQGVFLSGFGELSGRSALDPDTVDRVVERLEEKGLLFATELHRHSYPHCWRCGTELLFRLVDEWFIEMSWRSEIMNVCREIRWIPEFGLERELDWLRNMGDWMISKKRYWGLALPIWVCEACEGFEVIGSREELERRAVAGWERMAGRSPHRPWIDLVKIACTRCGNEASRIPDVGNPWLDAGIVPYSTLRYGADRAYWQKWFPADLVTECFPGQFRNWFYALLAMSAMMEARAPVKVLLGHGLVHDEHGEEMHKSKGNSIAFDEAAERIGADVMRWMFCRQSPSADLSFGYAAAEDVRKRFLLKLWNVYVFYSGYADIDRFDPAGPSFPPQERPDLDRWILSELQRLVESARREFERFNVAAFCLETERFVDERLSNWYVRRSRRRFWKGGAGADKLSAYHTLHEVLVTLSKLLAPITPFVAEAIYRNLSGGRPDAPASVHHCDYPAVAPELCDPVLCDDMDRAVRVVAIGLALRNEARLKVRQPLSELRLRPGSAEERRAVERFRNQIEEELNVKRVTIDTSPAAPAEGWLRAPSGATEAFLDTRLTAALAREGIAREIVRHVQDLRKRSGLAVEDRIHLRVEAEAEIVREAIGAHGDFIHDETLATEWSSEPLGADAHRKTLRLEGKTAVVEIRKL
ncbi:MAG: class I tRNA ligase family protein, partial [Candidatus Binatia bacterium]